MKRLFTFFAVVMVAVSTMAAILNLPKADIKGDLSKYKYANVILTGGVTSSSGTYGTHGTVYGGATRTINPSEMISGCLMQRGFTILPAVDPALADETLIVSYGNTGRRQLSIFSYATCIIVQLTDAATHEVVASFEAEGCGSDETADIHQAINSVFELLDYSKSPVLGVEIQEVYKSAIGVLLLNRTPNAVESFTLRITYFLDGEKVHEQYYTKNVNINPGRDRRINIKRDKEAQSNKNQIRIEVVSYN